MEEFFEDVENTDEIIEEVYEEDSKENTEDLQEDIPEVPQDKSDSGFTSKDVVDIIKAITGNNEDTAEEPEVILEPEEVSSGNSEEPEEEVHQNETEIVTYDYSEILQEIKNEVSAGNSETRENGLLLTSLVDDNKPDTPIDNLSVTNLLLICIFVLMLVEMLFKIIRGLF